MLDLVLAPLVDFWPLDFHLEVSLHIKCISTILFHIWFHISACYVSSVRKARFFRLVTRNNAFLKAGFAVWMLTNIFPFSDIEVLGV